MYILCSGSTLLERSWGRHTEGWDRRQYLCSAITDELKVRELFPGGKGRLVILEIVDELDGLRILGYN